MFDLVCVMDKSWNGKWGNETAMLSTMTQVVSCKAYVLCKVVQVLARGGRPIVLFSDPSREESRKNKSTLAVAKIK